ncbi:MAG: hypothetical protein E6K68_08160 [Nitrospirae bacterium]|nr:MAG: hypothetical protein E6K68_08160 [Nitrospirota bacterium]
MRRILKYSLLALGILAGSHHLWLAIKAWFVFRNDEPFPLYIFMFAGPLSTLPASITAFFKPKVGGTWLICGSILAFIAAMVTAGPKRDLDTAMWFFTNYSAPMLVLGIAVFLLARKGKVTEKPN